MADKEATVYIVDVGRDMGVSHHGRSENDLEWGMRYIWDKIATTISTGRKTLCSGVVAFRTDGTNNELDNDEDDSYKHISVIQDLGQILMPNVRQIGEQIKPSKTNEGDAISAIVVAIDMISKFCKKLKYIRRIILVTNGTGLMDSSNLSDIASKIKEDGIELIVLGADFNDLDYGFKEEDKSDIKSLNEETLLRLVNESDGVLGTLDQAVTELGIPRLKSVRPVHSYRGYMTLGNPKQYKTALCIDVERYPRTMIAKAPSASNFVKKSAAAQDEVVGDVENGLDGNVPQLASVQNTRGYQVRDGDAPGGKRDVEREELSKGYEYGRTAVPISESDESVTKLETTAGLEILGFVPANKFKRYMPMSRSNIIIPQRTNEKAVMAMSSFVNALYELECYAVARLVTKDGKEPVMVLLAWHNLNEYECLYEVELPFTEDVRQYKFPPLDRVVTISGKVLKEHRNLPNDAVMQAMDEYVDSMDLSGYDKDDEGNSTEYLPLDEIYSPLLHRINQVIRYRAVHPNRPVPHPHDILLKASKAPAELVQQAVSSVQKLREAADVKKGIYLLIVPNRESLSWSALLVQICRFENPIKQSTNVVVTNLVPPKSLARKRGRGRQREAPLSGLDISDLLSTARNPDEIHISRENAIPEFRQALEAAESVKATHEAVRQLSVIIEDWLRDSVGDGNYGRAIEAIRVMRECCVELEEPGVFNDWFRAFKEKILASELGGDRREFWRGVRGVRLGLIDKKLCTVSKVDEEEAKEFFSLK